MRRTLSHISSWQKLLLTIHIITLACLCTLSAQTIYTDQDVLQIAVRNHQANLALLNPQQKLNFPGKQWIDQMEFRTEFNELDLNEQEYTFRMRFRNDKVRKLEIELLNMKQDLLESETKSNVDDGAENVYKQMLALYFNQELDSLISYKLDLLKDKNAVATTLLLSDENVDFNDALKIKEREFEIKQKLYDIKWEKESILRKLGFTDIDVQVTIGRLITIEALSTAANNVASLEELHPDLSNFEARMNILEKERQLELEDTQTLLRFAQLRYKADNDFSLERELSLGIGFNIPYKNVDKLNIAKLELEQIEQELDKKEIQLDIHFDTEEELAELTNLISKHQYLVQLLEEENLSQLKKEYIQSERIKALPLINLELMIIDRQIDILQSKQNIYNQYITTLDRSGVLRFSNNTNWLDQDLRPIE